MSLDVAAIRDRWWGAPNVKYQPLEAFILREYWDVLDEVERLRGCLENIATSSEWTAEWMRYQAREALGESGGGDG